MTIVFEERLSNSPFIETITHGRTVGTGTPIRPAETNWHMVFVNVDGAIQTFLVGPWTTSGMVYYEGGAEILWLKFKLGTFMPHLPTRDYLNMETVLPEGSRDTFWLKSDTWQLPDFYNVEVFVDMLVREEVLIHDPLIPTVLRDESHDIADRTVRHRFLRATGMSQNHIRQVERARHAATLLQQGKSILDAVYEVGYFDQPHLTKSLKQYIGYTPAQHIAHSCIQV
jgi:AraC-like DNA-binding protein